MKRVVHELADVGEPRNLACLQARIQLEHHLADRDEEDLRVREETETVDQILKILPGMIRPSRHIIDAGGLPSGLRRFVPVVAE